MKTIDKKISPKHHTDCYSIPTRIRLTMSNEDNVTFAHIYNGGKYIYLDEDELHNIQKILNKAFK